MSNNVGGRKMKIKVYHGGIETVEKPVCAFGRKNLDFGQGFYVTDMREQAVKWAVLTAQKRKGQPVINRYLLDKDALTKEAISGLMSADIALKRLAMHQPNNQICLLNQSLTDKYLEYDRTESAE